MRLAAKKDINHDEIRDAVLAVGRGWWDTFRLGDGSPDAVIGGELPCPHCGRVFTQAVPIEIKTQTGILLPNQVAWHDNWFSHGGRVEVVRTIEEALKIAGVM